MQTFRRRPNLKTIDLSPPKSPARRSVVFINGMLLIEMPRVGIHTCNRVGSLYKYNTCLDMAALC